MIEIKLANGKEFKSENGSDISEFYERMRPRKKRQPKVNLNKDVVAVKDDGVTVAFTMNDLPEITTPEPRSKDDNSAY